MPYLFDPPAVKALPVAGRDAAFPIRRIFCVGRNYAAHAAEMGGSVDREAPWYFTKSAEAYLPSGSTVPYPPGTTNFHHEVELVVGIGAPVFRADGAAARAAVWGYGTGLDMTRRDLQQVAKDNRRPWALAKDVEHGAVLSPLLPAAEAGELGPKRIHLAVNGVVRQDATLADMVWSVEEIVCHLSGYYHLAPGDIIMTGTPAGVGAVVAGDAITGGIDGLPGVTLTLGPAE